ncbi:MAG: NUDIX hydrolase [Holosporales bacterium]|jgi:8-oxo-dGTP pyrophosphatase MutT (NUDIX family)|nr:NUDIX hydrolase [Holosporales bacterium]
MMLNFLLREPNCFDRSCTEGHFTASGWLEDTFGTNVLLTHHKQFNDWFQLGGHADGDHDLIRVALKETHEESGLLGIELLSDKIFDIDVHLVPEYFGIQEHYHYDVRFLLRATNENEDIQISDESIDLQWFSKAPTDSCDLNRMFEKWKKLK